jgi:hypothetical protein
MILITMNTNDYSPPLQLHQLLPVDHPAPPMLPDCEPSRGGNNNNEVPVMPRRRRVSAGSKSGLPIMIEIPSQASLKCSHSRLCSLPRAGTSPEMRKKVAAAA